jgi:hypothetical protein
MVFRRSYWLDWPGFGTSLPAPPILNGGRHRGVFYPSRRRVKPHVSRLNSVAGFDFSASVSEPGVRTSRFVIAGPFARRSPIGN